MSDPAAATGRLANLPISFFAMVMGLAGLTIAWEKAQHVFATDPHINPWLAGTSAAVFTVLLLLLSGIVLLLLVHTAIAVARKRICVPGH